MARSLVAVVCLLVLPAARLAAQADSTRAGATPGDITPGPGPHLGPPLPALTEPDVLRAPWLGGPRLTPALRTQAWDGAVLATIDSARIAGAAARRLLTLYGTRAEAPPEPGAGPPGPGPSGAGPPGQRTGPLGLSQKYADLALDGQVRLELRTDRLRNERCNPVLLLDPNSGCRGGFKAPRLDNQVNLQSSGVIGRRVHLNVDYDTERDFSANNDVQVYYQGLEDEIIRRVEVGTVTFRPPASRFITAAIPANNFGVNASFEVGAFQFQTLAATQKGSQVAERTYTIGQTTSQPQDRQLRDLDFETGRFFWVIDPADLAGYPAVDVLNLSPTSLPASARPAEVRVYRYRAGFGQNAADPNLGGIRALAQSPETDPNLATYGPVRWELLIQGTDYYLDPSGFWLALATKLDPNDYLAVSYVTAVGTRVGTFPAQDAGQSSTDTLRLVVRPQQGPTTATFRHEMRQVYRVAGSDLDPASLRVNLSVNQSERPLQGAPTYLAQLGLSIPTDANIFDRENRLFPRDRDPAAPQVVRESYLIFPHLTPFADRSRLTDAERSDSLYRTPLYLLLDQGPTAKFQLRLRYNSTGAGDRSTLSLGALQIRDSSEQLEVGGRRLERGVDYTIAYETGEVTFLQPDALFGGGGAATITARFEEQELFAVAPTTILGLSTRYGLGETGAINLIGMYQREQSAFNRPALGFEASANLIGGVNTELHFKPNGVTRLLGSLTSAPAVAPSQLDVNAEFAFTKPDPNRSGQAYIEEFEADAGVPISLRETLWEFGSQPQDSRGAEVVGFAGGFDPADAVALTWQNLVPGRNGGATQLRPEDIDTLIRIVGRGEQLETPMFLTLHADTAGGVVQQNNASRWSLPARPFRPRWRSMVTSLSPTGIDLTRNEYLEFWVFQPPDSRTADSAGVRLLIDLGTVNEDALALAPDSIRVNGADTVFTGRQYVGRGRLDSERSGVDVFNAEVDDHGILGDRPDTLLAPDGGEVDTLALCQRILAAAVPVFPWGDLSGRCTRGNGELDTEDLDGDNVLNASGANDNVFRYVVTLQRGDRYFVRDGRLDPATGRSAGWELYRVPLRDSTAITIGTPNLRSVRHLRVTAVAPPDEGGSDVVARWAFARMRLVGSPWVRRAETPIAGLAGSVGKPGGDVVVSVVSTEDRTALGYTSPPGVIEAVARRGGDRNSLGTQINEKSLRILAHQLDVGDRAEAYLRFPAGPQTALNYRELRVWMRGRGPGWEEGELQAFIKVGSDDRNFYLYRANAHSVDWVPEFAVDLEVWRRLRAEVETRWLQGQPPSGAAECGGDPAAYVACDGPYLVHLADPGINPPNLVAIQEISAGIYRAGGAGVQSEAELWVDDIRLDRPVAETGTAMALDARLIASDVGNVSLALVRQDGQFRQLNQDPTYRTTGTLQLNTAWRLDRFLPTSLGLSVPLTVTYARSAVDPQLITGTDLRGDALVGLRRPQSWSATYNLAVRRNQQSGRWLVHALVDPLALTASFNQGRTGTELTNARAEGLALNALYNLQLQRRGVRLPIAGLLARLPRWLREGNKPPEKPLLSLVPSNLRLSSGLTRNEGDYSSFGAPVSRPVDSLVQPTISLTHLWRNSGGLTWQPLSMLTLNGDLASTRDLRVYPDSTSLGRLAYAERRFLLGVPVGVERDRTLTTALALTPRISAWLRPRYTTSSTFLLARTLNTRPLVRAGDDSTGAFILPQTLNNGRSREAGVSLDLARAFRQFSGDSSGLTRLLARVRPLDLSAQRSRNSTFDLTAFDPSVGYMLALGGLDRFLAQEGASAVSAVEARTTTLGSGADLPFGLTATLSYSLVRTERYQRVADGFTLTASRQREWPVGTLRWSRTFRGGPFSLVAAGAAFRRREGTSAQAGDDGPGVASATNSSSLTPDLQLGLRNGMNFAFGLSDREQRTENNGNATVLDQSDFTGAFSYSFRLPESISRARKPVRSSLNAVTSKALTCLTQGGQPDCTVVSDVRRQELRGGLDTDLLRTLSGGLQLGYSINDARHLSRRTSQIFALVSFQLSLFAGDYR